MSNKCECKSWCRADDLGFIPSHHPKCERFNDSLIDVAVIECEGSKCYDENIEAMRSWSRQMDRDGEEHQLSVIKMHREKLEQMPEFEGF